MDAPNKIGERLLLARRRKAITQSELANLAGVKRLTISRIERGEFFEFPRPGTVKGLADALGVEAAWLLFGEDEGKAAA